AGSSLVHTFEQMLREQTPNLFRLYLNPYVTQTCFCLERYVQTTWHADAKCPESFQTFLANSFDEALSGAIKLARYCGRLAGKPPHGVILDAANRLGAFAGATARGARVEFLPGLTIARAPDDLPPDSHFGFAVWTSPSDPSGETHAENVRLLQERSAFLIVCVDRLALQRMRARKLQAEPAPDIVVFDESFANHD